MLKRNKKTKSSDNVQQGLVQIYSNQDGSLPDISQLEITRTSKLKFFGIIFVVIALFLSVAAWAGFLFFGSGGVFSNRSLALELESQQSIASGDEVTYILNYENVDKVALNDLEIIIRYPEGFEFIEANPSPSNEFNSAWNLGRLEKNQSGKIEIKGKVIGEVGSIKTINATASFKPENFSSVFKESQSFSSQVTSSILELAIDGSSSILPEKQTSYTIKYKNNSDQELALIKVQLSYPEGFIFQESEPKPFANQDDARQLNNQWLIEKLAPKEEGEIKITGGFAPGTIGQALFKVQIGFLSEENDTDFSLQQERDFITEVVDAQLNLQLIINGSNQSQPIGFDQPLVYSIVYKNLGQQDINNAVIKLTVDGDLLDWGTLEDPLNGKRVGNVVTWTKEELSALEVIRPLSEGTIDFTVYTKKSANAQNIFEIKSVALATMEKIGEMEAESLEVKSNEIQNNINTDVDLKVEGRYFNDDNIAVGTGPLPPVVGQETSFRIYWSLANSLNEVSDVSVTATLPSYVEWSNKLSASVGSLSYDAKTRTVTWEISRITPNKTFDDVNAWFDISVTPTSNQARTILILSDQATLSAVDNKTELNITKTSKSITSNLEDDPSASGKGLVIDIR